MNQPTDQARASTLNGNEVPWVSAEQAKNPLSGLARASVSNGGVAVGATTVAFRFVYGTAPSAQSSEDSRFHRIKVPIFNGEDPHGRLFRLEQYFQVQGVKAAEWVAAAVIGLEGNALNWMESKFGVVDWLTFKESVLQRFWSSQTRNHYEALITLQQESSVAEF